MARQRKYGDRSEANRIGGFARAKALTPERRVEIAVEARSLNTNPGRKKLPPKPPEPPMSDAEFIAHCRQMYEERGSFGKKALPRLLELAGRDSSKPGNFLCDLAEAKVTSRLSGCATAAQGAGNEAQV